jgi:putative transposase
MMQELRLQFPVPLMGRMMKVSTSGYYSWVARPLSKRAREEMRLELEIRAADKRISTRIDSKKELPWLY